MAPGATDDCLAARDSQFVQLWIVDSDDNLLLSDTAGARPGVRLTAPVAFRNVTL